MKEFFNMDNKGEVVNGEATYDYTARLVSGEGRCLIGWTDQEGTHYDILFVNGADGVGMLQDGIKHHDLFVSIMRLGAFAFDKNNTDTDFRYYGEKLFVGSPATAKKLAELINNVKKRLM